MTEIVWKRGIHPSMPEIEMTDAPDTRIIVCPTCGREGVPFTQPAGHPNEGGQGWCCEVCRIEID